jgi:hypothetical protein
MSMGEPWQAILTTLMSELQTTQHGKGLGHCWHHSKSTSSFPYPPCRFHGSRSSQQQLAPAARSCTECRAVEGPAPTAGTGLKQSAAMADEDTAAVSTASWLRSVRSQTSTTPSERPMQITPAHATPVTLDCRARAPAHAAMRGPVPRGALPAHAPYHPSSRIVSN